MEKLFQPEVQKGGKFNTFCEEEIAEILPKIMTRTAKIRHDGVHLLFEEYLLVLTPLYILNLPRNRENKGSLT